MCYNLASTNPKSETAVLLRPYLGKNGSVFLGKSGVKRSAGLFARRPMPGLEQEELMSLERRLSDLLETCSG